MNIDPKLQTCSNCGCSWSPGTIHKIIMLIFGCYIWTCPQCQSRLEFRLMNHVVKVNTEKVLDERIWRRC